MIDAAKTKLFGFMPFYPGPPGGHCTRSIRSTCVEVRQNGSVPLLLGCGPDQPSSTALTRARVAGRRTASQAQGRASIHTVGVAYKRDVNDMRESPALDVLDALRRRGAVLSYSDPWVPQLSYSGLTMSSIELSAAIAQPPDCAVICTDHSGTDYDALVASGTLIVDTRNASRTAGTRFSV